MAATLPRELESLRERPDDLEPPIVRHLPSREPTTAGRSWREWAGLVEILILAACARLIWREFQLDDTFITFTFARSLAAGHGWEFGAHQVLGTTTPLYALLLALASFTGLPMLAVAQGIGLAAALGTCLVLYVYVRNALGSWPGLLAALLLAVNPHHAAISMSGMETGLDTLVCVSAFYLYTRRHPVPMALAAAVACLLRPDGLLVPVILLVCHLLERRGPGVPALLTFLVPTVTWLGYAAYRFGSPVPTSMLAKLAYHGYGPFSLKSAFGMLGSPLAIPLMVASGIGLVYLLLYRRTWSLLPLVMWGALYVAAFLRAPNFPWYYVPPLPALIALGVAGLTALGTGFRAPQRRPSGRWGNFRLTLATTAAVTALVFSVLETHRYRDALDRSYGPEVAACYRDLADWLRESTPQSATIGVPEVGYVGYFSNREVLDLAGLCSPQVIPYLRRNQYVEILQTFHPEYVALTDEPERPIHAAILASPWFRDQYHSCRSFPYRGHRYIIFERSPVPVASVAPSGDTGPAS